MTILLQFKELNMLCSIMEEIRNTNVIKKKLDRLHSRNSENSKEGKHASYHAYLIIIKENTK